MNYIYLIDFDEFLVCLNFINTNSITCASIVHYSTFGTEYPLFKVDPDMLLNDINSLPTGFVSPRLSYIIISCKHRNGLKTGIGMPNPKWFNEEQIEKIHRKAELEIEFEKVRRQINSELPSRLTCIFLAEDNLDGRIMLQNMFPQRTNFLLAKVEINYSKGVHKADSKWLSLYEDKKDISAIESYWKGKQFDDNPQYEYLLEGQISLTNSTDRDLIKEKFDANKQM